MGISTKYEEAREKLRINIESFKFETGEVV